MPRFKKDRERELEKALLARLSQNVLTCPTTACFNLLDTDPFFKLGRKIALFGDQHQFRARRFGRRVWVVPIMSGEFVLDRRFGSTNGIMGGNLWFFGETGDSALDATGGIASSGSKAGSRYSFMFASTNHPFCPSLREKLGEKSDVPDGVSSIQEIIINGRNLDTVAQATWAAIDATVETPGLIKISAGNYNGRLGKSFIYLHPDKQPVK